MSKLTDLLLADAYIGGGSGGGGGGEKWTETLLWENPNPNNNYGSTTNPQGSSSISIDVASYDFIKLIHRINTSAQTTITSIYPPDFSEGNVGVFGAMFNGSYDFRMFYCTKTRANIGNASCAMGKTTYSTSTNIPLAIYGIKKG